MLVIFLGKIQHGKSFAALSAPFDDQRLASRCVFPFS